MSGITNSLFPAGYLSTQGGQVVDSTGAIARIQSIAWFGTEGPAGTWLTGLPNNNPNDPATQTGIQNALSGMVSEGFNTVRIPWSDANLQSSLPLLKLVVADAGKLGLRVIFDHHDDDGHYSQQPNGLWFDTGPGSDGTDGGGDTGTISAAQFQADTVTLASTFAGNATVIGFDLDNEPLVNGGSATGTVNWGGGGPTDILAMYNAVGSAVEAADPGALIIAEGPQNWSGTLLNGQSGLATEGDLSAAAAKPVTLTVNGQTVANKVVYSVHEYPSTIGGEPTDSGSSYIQQMNAAWGYLEAGNIAPVWIGEMGASLDGTNGDSAGAANLANEQAWAATLIPYLNGQDAAQGGPSVKTGFDWWTSGGFAGGQPDGYNSGPNGSVNAAQQAIVSQLLTYFAKLTQPSGPPVAASANDTALIGSSGAIIDTSGNKWTITSGGQVAINGVTDTTTAGVIEMAYVDGTIWQENSSNLWWGKTQAGAAWGTGTGTSPLPPPPSANATVVKLGSSAAISDANGNKWTITSAGLVAVNGVTDATTANVIELAYVNGTVWQENSSKLWWGKTQPTAAWGPGTGTATSPLPPPASANDTVVKLGSTAAIVDASGNKWTITSAGLVAVNGVADTTTANVIELAYANGTVWQENSSKLWWGKTQPSAAWGPGAGTATSPLPPPASANDTVVKLGSTAAIVDASGNKWTITSAGLVAVNGVADTTTAQVAELAYVNGTVWQENNSKLWWGKTQPTAAWSPSAGTSTSPLPTTVTIPSTQSSETVSLNQVSIIATSGSHMVLIQGTGDTVKLSGGTDTITDTAGGNTYVLPAAAKGYDTFTSNILTAGDTLDLRTALAATNWTGTTSTLANYLSVANTTKGAVLSIAPTSGGAGVAIATISGSPTTTLSALLTHALT